MAIRLKLNDPEVGGSLPGGLATDVVVFDCDGVLLETIQAKLQAYMDWMPQEHESLKETFAAHNRKSFGQSRGIQIRYLFEQLAGEGEVSDAFLDSEVERFSAICEPLCEAAPWAEGAQEFVDACKRAGSRTVVLSGTPQEELEGMLRQREAMGLFDWVMGFPITKEEGLQMVLEKYGVPANRILFIGDAQRDAEAAQAIGAHFVYRPSEADRPVCPIVNEAVDLRSLLH